MSDPNDLADRLDQIADPNFPGSIGYTAARDMRAAARLLREQAEQLDTLRNAIGASSDAAQFARIQAERTNGEWVHRDITQFVAGWDAALTHVTDALAAAGGGVPEEGA